MPETSKTINSRTLAFIFCRVLALYVLYEGSQSAFYAVAALIQNSLYNPAVNFRFFNVAHVASYFVQFLLFWFGASWLSNRMTLSTQEQTSQKVLDIDGLFSVIVSGVGLVFMVTAMSRLAGLTALFITEGQLLNMRDTGESAVKLAIGLTLLLGVRRITTIIKRART